MVEEKGRQSEGERGEEEGVGRGTEEGKNLFGGKSVGEVEHSFVEAEN